LTTQLWYIEIAVNNLNSRVYIDMINSMRELKNGVFTCTYKLNDGIISDLVTFDNEVYVDPTSTKVNPVS